MSLQHHVQKPAYLKIGRYQSKLEDGQLKLYSHQFGSSTGISCTFSPEETKALLEMLTSRSDDIDSALHTSEDAQAPDHRYIHA
jgi:hypothetical protein